MKRKGPSPSGRKRGRKRFSSSETPRTQKTRPARAPHVAAAPTSTQQWQWSEIEPLFARHGCSDTSCEFHRPPDCSGDTVFCCALNVSDALIRAGYSLPGAANVNYCAHGRVRNADGMARICNKQNGGRPAVQEWKNRPNWKGIVYFEGGTVTQHIDFWNGTSAEHTQYPDASVVWFWRMGQPAGVDAESPAIEMEAYGHKANIAGEQTGDWEFSAVRLGTTYLRGIDVSHHQGPVDWRAAKEAGIAFAIVKATEGETFVDPRFHTNWSELKMVGIVRGAYHFFRPKADTNKQAMSFLETLGRLEEPDFPPVLDVETVDGVSATAILDGVGYWIEQVQAATARKVVLYTGVDFWKTRLGDSQRFADQPLWIAHYTSAPHPTLPGGWTVWSLWQHSDQGTVTGINGAVDLDRLNTSMDLLRGLTTLRLTSPV